MISFVNPEVLWFVLLPLLGLLGLIFTNKDKISRVFEKEVFAKLTAQTPGVGKAMRNTLMSIALLCMVLALARPVIEKEPKKVEVAQTKILLALDISGSMRSRDLYPNRLEFAKQKLGDFIAAGERASFALMAFSSHGFLVSPSTDNKQVLLEKLKHLRPDRITSGATDIAVVINSAAKLLEGEREKPVVVFTDGGDKRDWHKEIAAAKEKGISLYTVLVATQQGAPVLDANQKPIGDAWSNRNDTIGQLSRATGAYSVAADFDSTRMQKLFARIMQKHRPNSKAVVTIDQNIELFPFLLWGATGVLLLGFASLPKLHLLLLPLLLQPVSSRAGLFDFVTLQKAQEAYAKHEYENAAKHYRKVLGSPQSYFNLADSYYKAGRYKEAIENYKRVETKDSELKAKAEYNLANAYVKTKQYDKALQRYERSLQLQEDADARYNYEWLKKLLERSKQKNGEKKKQKGDAAASQKNPKADPQKGKKAPKSQKPQPQKAEGKNRQSGERVSAPAAGGKSARSGGQNREYEKYKKQLPAPPTQLFVIERGADDTNNPW